LSKLKGNTPIKDTSIVSYFSYIKHLFSHVASYTFLLACFCGTLAQAEEVKDYVNSQDFQLHGFISQGIIDVSKSDFVNDNGAASAELTELGLNVSYQLTSTLRLAGQVVYLDGGNRYAKGIRLDYALIDWSAYSSEKWQANIYLGRFKNNHWLYSSSRDIPFARPSIILPQSVYFDGFRDIAVGSDGIATKVSYSDDTYGDFDWQSSYGTSPISDEQIENLLSNNAQGNVKQDYDAQTSLYWQPPFSAWRFGLSYLEASFSYDGGTQAANNIFFDSDFYFKFHTFNAIYEGEKWEFSGEIYQQEFTIDGFYSPNFEIENIGQGFYLQSRYKLTPKLTLLARYEDFYQDKDDKRGRRLEKNTGGFTPRYFGFHKSTTLGINYDITSNSSIRTEYHWVSGASKLTPIVVPNRETNASKRWSLWAIQLMYWF